MFNITSYLRHLVSLVNDEDERSAFERKTWLEELSKKKIEFVTDQEETIKDELRELFVNSKFGLEVLSEIYYRSRSRESLIMSFQKFPKRENLKYECKFVNAIMLDEDNRWLIVLIVQNSRLIVTIWDVR